MLHYDDIVSCVQSGVYCIEYSMIFCEHDKSQYNMHSLNICLRCTCSSVDRALPSGGRSQGFESLQVRHYDVADVTLL